MSVMLCLRRRVFVCFDSSKSLLYLIGFGILKILIVNALLGKVLWKLTGYRIFRLHNG